MRVRAERTRLNGVVYTPSCVADEVVRIGLNWCFSDSPRILEPSAGDGAFLNALVSREVHEKNITAVDIDKNAIEHLRSEYGQANVVESDFLEYALNKSIGQFDLIVGNPPFIKRVGYSTAFREGLRELGQRTGFPLADMKNAWVAFVIVAANLVNANGVIALVVPYELVTVKYGRVLQRYLIQNGFSVDIFVSDESAFPSIEQDAVILLARSVGSGNEELRINRVMKFSQIETIQSSTVHQRDDRKAAIDVKSVLFDSETTSLLNRLRAELGTIRDYCESAPGIVTAANEFFILRTEDVERLKLKPWARRILKKSSYLPKSPTFAEDDLIWLAKSQPCELIDFHWATAPPLSEDARKFIEQCEENEVHKRYKCSRRRPWYRIPIVPPAEGLFFKRAHIFPRLCVNEAKVLVTDTAYHIRMKEGFNIRDLCFSFYNSITLLFAEIDGRFYGGGVLELTPSEFRDLPLPFLTATDVEFEDFESRFPKSSALEATDFSDGDRRARYELKITKKEMYRIKTALKTLRVHRLRHARATGSG
ncbi:MAG: methyltransferase [Paracoccaceae bacterium]|nr:methyltransferase [Paracoccaceae bacterium]